MRTYILNLNAIKKIAVSATLVAVSVFFVCGQAGKMIVRELVTEEIIIKSITAFYPLLSVQGKNEIKEKNKFPDSVLNEDLEHPDKVIAGNFPIFSGIRGKLSELYSDIYESNPFYKPESSEDKNALFPKIEIPQNAYRAIETTSESIISDGDELKKKGLTIKNHTTFTPDIESLYRMPLDFMETKKEPAVLIVHTHGSESYNPSDRSENTDTNIVRVGREMAKVFKRNKINVIHSEIMHDIPRFNSSYSKSLKTVTAELNAHPEISVVLDVHRDAMMNENGDSYKTVCEYNGEKIAQVMFVVGTDGNGLEHPNWEKNLSLALKLQEQVNKICPNLARPIDLRNERFNQQSTPGSLIIEIGTNGNTLDEAVKAGILAAEAISEVIKPE